MCVKFLLIADIQSLACYFIPSLCKLYLINDLFGHSLLFFTCTFKIFETIYIYKLGLKSLSYPFVSVVTFNVVKILRNLWWRKDAVIGRIQNVYFITAQKNLLICYRESYDDIFSHGRNVSRRHLERRLRLKKKLLICYRESYDEYF